MTARLAGFDPSINTFFNALIREHSAVEYRASHKDASHGCFVFHNQLNRECLLIPCLHRSGTGRHTLGSHLVVESGGSTVPVDFRTAIEWCLRLPELQQGSSATSRQRFLRRVLNSHRNLTHIRARSSGRQRVTPLETPMPFIDGEHALIHGHPDHPFPRDRGNMTVGESLCYTPELGDHFPLAWYSVDRRQLMTSQVNGLGLGAMTANLFDPACARTLAAHPPGHVLVPCHPLQHYHWQANPAIRRLQGLGKVRFLGMGKPEWQATSSAQTVWSPHHEWMVRFSLSVRLQGRHRHVSRTEANRGPTLTRLLDRPALRRWLRHTPHFVILREPVTLALLDDTGQDLDATRITLRDNPFRGRQGERAEMLATLLQEDPEHGQSRLAMALARHRTSPRQWFQQFLDRVADPLLEAQSRFGLLLGCHPQNLVLGLNSRFLPERVWYRGAQDSLSVGPEQASTARRDRQRQAEEEAAIRLFCHDLFVDSIFNIIASLTRAELCSEGELLTLLKHWLQLRRAAVHQDSRAMDYLLASPCLFARSTILANLHDPDAPGAVANDGPLCCPIPNPLSASPTRWPTRSFTETLEDVRRAAV